jgi:uncharacterized protein YdgA (DUF945 family)
MKKAIWVIAVLVLAYPAYPWLIGGLIESRVDQGLNAVVQQAPYIKIVEKQWTRGWYRSEQVVTFEVLGDFFEALRKIGNAEQQKTVRHETLNEEPRFLRVADPEGALPAEPTQEESPTDEPAAEEAPLPKPMDALKPWRITVRNSVLHGPILGLAGVGLARVDTHLVLSPEIEKQLKELFGDRPPATLQTRVGFFGGGKTMFEIPGGKFTDKEGSEVTWDDIEFDVAFSRHADSVSFDGSMPSVTAKHPLKKDHLTLESFTFDGEFERATENIYVGDAVMHLDKLSGQSATGKPFNLEDLEYVVDAKQDGDFLTMAVEFGTGVIAVEAKKFKDMHFDMTFRRVHLATFEKFSKASKEIYTKKYESTEEIAAAALSPWVEHGAQLLLHDPELVFDRITFANDDGAMLITGVVRMKGITAADLEADWSTWFAKLEADFDFKISEKMILNFEEGGAAAKAQIDQSIEQGMASRQGGDIVSKLSYRDGAVTVNGKPFQLPNFSGPPQPAVGPDGQPMREMTEEEIEQMLKEAEKEAQRE